MFNISNSYSLSEFQRNAKGFIEGLNKSHEPVLLTVNGKVQAVLVDPVSYQKMEETAQREKFIAALKEGLEDIDSGRTRPLEAVYADMKAKYGL
ncbi:MAG TPA: type II toxin-antitoxin system Phd/YefM family antitoxin [Fimbriimonadaceae bacterium]|jgi:prevent-host-death family protein